LYTSLTYMVTRPATHSLINENRTHYNVIMQTMIVFHVVDIGSYI
jgi:hypothetical protein